MPNDPPAGAREEAPLAAAQLGPNEVAQQYLVSDQLVDQWPQRPGGPVADVHLPDVVDLGFERAQLRDPSLEVLERHRRRAIRHEVGCEQ